MIIFFLLFFLFLPTYSYAANIGYWSYTLKAFGSLILVLGLIVVFFFVLKKINSMGRYSSARIKLKSKLYLDNRHYLAIVEVDGKEMLIGVGESVTILKKLGDDDEEV